MSRFGKNIWWLGVPGVVALLTWLPYFLLNTWQRVDWPIWRIPFVPIVLFDSAAYFGWIGPALSGYPAGNHIGLFVWVLRVLGFVLPDTFSVAEVWLFTLWMSVTLGLWIMARAIQAWSGLSVVRSRVLACCTWASLVLPFMGRPGVFTWYAPFYVFALLGVWRVYECLKKGSYPAASIWTVGALGAAWVYPYFLIHIVVWLSVVWFLQLHRRFTRSVRMLGIVGISSLPMIVGLITPVLVSQPALRLAVELRERMGLAFTWLPVLSNSLILVFLWGLFLAIVAYFFVKGEALRERAQLLLIGWTALAGSWLSNVFTGVYIHNDHFRGPAVFLAWLSLSFVYGLVQQEAREYVHQLPQKRLSWWGVPILVSVFIVASGLFLRYAVSKSFVFRGDQLNIVHVSHWFTLVAASLLVLLYAQKKSTYIVGIVLLAVVVALGASARLDLLWEEQKKFSLYIPYVSTITWVDRHVSAFQSVCTDPRNGEIFSSFTGRIVHPSFGSIALPKSNEEIVQQMQVQLGYYDARAAQTEYLFTEVVDSVRGTACSQFSFWSRISKWAGRSEADFLAMTGCPTENGELSYAGRIQEYLVSPKKDESRFREVCPVVIISTDQASYWSLPQDYREISINNIFSVWRSTPSLSP